MFLSSSDVPKLKLKMMIGPIVIAVDLTFLKGNSIEWIGDLIMGDFYTYLSFIGVVSIWSIFGFTVMLMRSVAAVTAYTIGLFCFVNIHFIIGFVHILMLFTTYRPILMDSCLQRQPTRYFWWSLGFENSKEMKEIYQTCSSQWTRFATERFVSWIVYSIISYISLYFVVKYQSCMKEEYSKAQSIASGDRDWSDDDTYIHGENDSKEKMSYYHEEFPNKANERELSAEMYQQRQKIYDAIAKRKRANSNLKRHSLASNSNRDSILGIHPLDLSQDPEVYRPPPMPPVDTEATESWNRYNDGLLKEEQEAIERQKKVDALSTERLEYEMYRAHKPQNEPSGNTIEEVEKGASKRRRPSKMVWSAYDSDRSATDSDSKYQSQKIKEVVKEEEEEEEEEDGKEVEEYQPIQPVSDEEQKEYIPDRAEDTYEHYQQQQQQEEEDIDASPSTSFLMRPAKEETMYK
ncbi:hypothetical protein BD770DRAFT_431438 [Pilaira anomala]|nr:hypothetical protein BD770DRAFT_431438 [Pilaira anomala]